jgi:uncharacterized protein YbjT (DUF2867 family)
MPLSNDGKDTPTSQPTTSQNLSHQHKRKILVVGATGFLGTKIQLQLELDPTVTLRAMSRRGAPADANAVVEWVRGDLMDPESLDAALKDVDVVVTSATARAGVKRFVFLSIVACDDAPAVPHFHATVRSNRDWRIAMLTGVQLPQA